MNLKNLFTNWKNIFKKDIPIKSPFSTVDGWKIFTEVDFSNEKFNQYSIDTRDFNCFATETPKTDIDLTKINKNPSRFYHTPDEVKKTLARLCENSGGYVEWRMLTLEGEGEPHSSNWQMKYFRIIRTQSGLLICNNSYYILSKQILKCEVNQEYLNAH